MKLKKTLMIAAAAVGLWVAAPAGADTTSTQTIDATIPTSITMSTTPTASIGNWTLAPTGANTTSGGNVVVEANTAYKVTVQADKAKMTEWITASSAYETTSPKALTNSLSVLTTATGGAGVPVASLAVGTSPSNIATGTGLTTDSYSVTLSQPTVIGDAPLGAGRTYHTVLTYTATSSL